MNSENQLPEQIDFMVTSRCNAICDMCVQEVTPQISDSGAFEEGAKIHFNEYYMLGGRRAVITGGEPTLAMRKVLCVLDILSDYPAMELIGIYTNGSRLLTIEESSGKTILERLVEKGITSINQSVHHYDIEKNSMHPVFKIPVVDPRIVAAHMRSIGIPFRYNATLQKGFLENSDDVLRYLDFAQEQGARDVYLRELFGFIGQSPTSSRGRVAVQYSEINRIPIEPILEDLESRGARRINERTDFQGRRKKEIGFTAHNGLPFYVSTLEIGSETPEEFPYLVVMPDGHLYSTWLGMNHRINRLGR